MLDLQLCRLAQTCLVWSGGLEPSNLPLFGRGITCKFIEGLHGRTPLLRWSASVRLGDLDPRVDIRSQPDPVIEAGGGACFPPNSIDCNQCSRSAVRRNGRSR
jgi:hypothetical protein